MLRARPRIRRSTRVKIRRKVAAAVTAAAMSVAGVGAQTQSEITSLTTPLSSAHTSQQSRPRPRLRTRTLTADEAVRPAPAKPVQEAAEKAPDDAQVAGKPEVDQEVSAALRQHGLEARAKFLQLCRDDVNAFCEYVLIDDESGRSVTQSPFHLQIQDDLTKHRQVVIMSHPESGKTSQLAVGRVLWELGRNPNLRIVLLYNSEDSAVKTLSTLRKYIETSVELRTVFPNLRRGDVWKDNAIVVQRTAYSRDPSVSAVGYNTRRIQGSRIDMLIVDDLLDSQTTATEAQRRKLSSWMKNPVLNRLSENALVAFLTNAWHPRDLAHELVRDRGWHQIKRPIRDPDGTVWWYRWTEARLKKARKELGALEYARSFECDPRDDGSRVFRPEHVENALARGDGYGMLHMLDLMPGNCIVVTGIDVAAGDDPKKQQGARTVLTSVFFHPNQQRQVIRIRSGRWRATQIIEEINAVGHAFPRNHWIVVENNGVQRWILELAQEHQMDVGVALVPFFTGRNKVDPKYGVASMAAEFESGRWILPKNCLYEHEQEEVGMLMEQMIDFVPESHTGDHLMSLWFTREIGRLIFKKFYGRGSDQAGSMVRVFG